MNKELTIYNNIKKHIENISNLDFFNGKLGASVGLLYYASKFEIEDIYDFALQQLHICFDSLKKDDYTNYNFDIAILGYLFENLKTNNVLDVDTDEILGAADVYISSSCSKTSFNISTHEKVISYCYYLTSRFSDKEINEKNFITFQVLVLKLIEISNKVEHIFSKKKLSSEEIKLIFNSYLLSNYLLSKGMCTGLSNHIKELTLRLKEKKCSNAESLFDRSVINFLKNDFSEFINILKTATDIISVTKQHDVSKTQFLTLIALLKSSIISNKEVWGEIKDQVALLIENDIFIDSKCPNIGILNGYSTYYWVTMDFGTVDYINLFPLNLFSKNNYSL